MSNITLYYSKYIFRPYKCGIKCIYSNYATLSDLSLQDKIRALRKMTLPKTRENPMIMKLDTPEFKSIFNDELQTLLTIFKEYGYDIRIAGGAVRDLLMGTKPKDLDFATTATPDQMKDMFTAENVRMINVNGEKHGTVTPRINDKENFEITTLRIDVLTDGRHAQVQFTTDWMLDALRRDLTINSMFLSLDGCVYDYFYGYDDLKKRRIAFVGDAVTRIREDYLRILRYFRFYGRIAVDPDNHEAETLTAIKENCFGLENISGERIWMELKKILEGNFAGNLMLTIVKCGIAPYIGLPENPNTKELERIWQQSGRNSLNAITLLSSLIYTQDDVIALNARLKLSAFERDLAMFVVQHREPKFHPSPLMPYQQLVVKAKSKPVNTKKMALEVLKYNNSTYIDDFTKWEIPKFPVSGTMLKEKGVEGGRFMGVVMEELRKVWAEGEFKLAAEELLEELPRVLDMLADRRKRK